MPTLTSPEPDLPTPLPSQPTPRKRKVMVSSTARDLPDHRQDVLDACLRQSFDPIMMEHLPAMDANAIQASLDMVDEADIYLGIFAYRYGWVPGFDNPQQISITEMEYRRAVERDMPRLIFFMHDDHPVRPSDVETGDGAAKLKKLKDEIGSLRVAGIFKSSEHLRSLLIDSLSKLPKSDAEQKRQTEFHYVSPIPPAPEVYVAHPYTLLTAPGGLVGRRHELNWLTDWVAGTRHAADSLGVSHQAAMNRIVSRLHRSRLFFFVAIGGQGKSALAWHWFQNIADQEMRPLAGRMWWSFYESDASFENFVIRALAYTAKISIEQAKAQPVAEREAWLLHLLDTQPFLIVLDGLERLLLAYSGGNVRGLEDDELDQRTAHRVAEAYGLDETAAQSYTGQARLRLTSDPRVGSFLRKLTHVRAARVLVTTRLYPSDLQIDALGEPVTSCFAYFLPGLSDDDALELWRSFGARGARENVLPVLASFEKHSLLVQALASEVARDRSARGDFEKWRAEHPDFNPFGLAHDQRRSHVLSHALRGLSGSHIWLLQTIAAFRMPTTYETLKDLACRMGTLAHPSSRKKSARKRGAKDQTQNVTGKSAHPTFDQAALDAALTELEDRGLVGWDRAANRYDLHPIVRGVVWNSLGQERRREVCETLQAHFQPIEVPDHLNVTSLEDLTPAIELFHALIELGRFDDACDVFYNRLDTATLYRLSASRLRIELVERLFPDGTDRLPRVSTPRDQSYTLNSLAGAYLLSGQPKSAVPLFRRVCDLDEESKDQSNLSIGCNNLSYAERLSGAVRAAEVSARSALRITRELGDEFEEAMSLLMFGLGLAVRFKKVAESEIRHEVLTALETSQQQFEQLGDKQMTGVVSASRAAVALWFGEGVIARTLADRAWEMAAVWKQEADFIRAARLQGTAALRCSGGPPESEQTSRSLYEFANERLHHALTRARKCDLVDEELPTLIALAELHEALARTPVATLARVRGEGTHAVASPTHALASVATSHDGTLGSPLGRREPESLTTSLQLTPAEHLDQAERLLDDVWDRAERGPYPLFQADAFNRLASLERTCAALLPADSPERTTALDRAGKAALRAYEKAWLDGPPFAYAFGLSNAAAHLADLGITPPDLPPYDDSRFPPMPDEPIVRKKSSP